MTHAAKRLSVEVVFAAGNKIEADRKKALADGELLLAVMREALEGHPDGTTILDIMSEDEVNARMKEAVLTARQIMATLGIAVESGKAA